MADSADPNSANPSAFQQAVVQLAAYGTPGAVAAFQIGWDVEHLRRWQPSWQPPEPEDDGRGWAARKILRIESALGDLRGTLIPKSLSIDTAGSLAAVAGEPYEATLTASGGQLPYKWTITGLPEGLTFDEGTGLIDGTPAKVATSALQVQVQDATGVSASAWLTLVVTQKGDPFGPACYPSTTSLRRCLASIPDQPAADGPAAAGAGDTAKEFHDAVDAFGAQMWRALVVARASAPAAGISGGPQQPGTAMAATITEAYELGTRLAGVVLLAESETTKADVRKAFSHPEADPAKQAHALASRLRGAFPPGAALAVARHIEDWSSWLNEPAQAGRHEDWRAALRTQGRIWESLLTGQSLGKDYLVAASYADAADHLVATWSESTASIARSMWRTPVGKIAVALLGIAVVIIAAALAYNFGLIPAARKTDTSGPGVATVITVLVGALGGVAGLVHYARSHVIGLAQRVWGLAESPLAKAEMLEAVAMATRRLPGDRGTGGASGRPGSVQARRKQATAGAIKGNGDPKHPLGATPPLPVVPAQPGESLPDQAGKSTDGVPVPAAVKLLDFPGVAARQQLRQVTLAAGPGFLHLGRHQ